VADGDLWVFGYGSLMWRPGFPYRERATALVRGLHRRLCVVSRHHRGTVARPGLVMGLDRGGACRGVAYRVAADDVAATLDYLDEREIAHYSAYRRAEVTVALDTAAPSRAGVRAGVRTRAITYTVDRRDADYAGALTVAQQAALVAGAAGLSGSNPDYVAAAVAHIRELGLRDRRLEAVLACLEGQPSDQGRRNTSSTGTL